MVKSLTRSTSNAYYSQAKDDNLVGLSQNPWSLNLTAQKLADALNMGKVDIQGGPTIIPS